MGFEKIINAAMTNEIARKWCRIRDIFDPLS